MTKKFNRALLDIRVPGTENFRLYEFIDPTSLMKWGQYAQRLIDPDIINFAIDLRNFLDSGVKINNYALDQNIEYNEETGFYEYDKNLYGLRGFRPMDCPIGAKFSYHKLGGALDLEAEDLSSVELFQMIIRLKATRAFKGISRIENIERPDKTVRSWNHVDRGIIDGMLDNQIMVFNP